jgi:RNA-directed DNA polymerase
MQALHLLGLEPVAESTSDPNSYGFRKNRSTADAMSRIFVCMSRKVSASWVLEADIEGCFDRISHDWLENHVPMNRVILRKWLKAGVVHKGRLAPTDEGTPQGGIISPTLANMTLNGLETQLLAHLRAKVGVEKAQKLKVHVIRYADDFVITGISKEILETEVRPWIETFLAQRGLRLSPEKTRVTHIDDGFDFLGWNFRKYAGTLLITPSKKNVKAFYGKVRETIKINLMMKQEVLLSKLNPILRGWAQYHQPVVAKATFGRLDNLIYWRLVRWMKRRHPTKRLSWCIRKYWKQYDDRLEFAADCKMDDGSMHTIKLYRLADTPIIRHQMVKGEYNPFDPRWEAYGEELRMRRMLNRISYRTELMKLYTSQEGRCALCAEPLDHDSGWHDHHLERKVDGGSDALWNRTLMHPVCHNRLHVKGLKVIKPAPAEGS